MTFSILTRFSVVVTGAYANVNTYSEGVPLHQNSVAPKGLQAAGKDKHPEI